MDLLALNELSHACSQPQDTSGEPPTHSFALPRGGAACKPENSIGIGTSPDLPRCRYSAGDPTITCEVVRTFETLGRHHPSTQDASGKTSARLFAQRASQMLQAQRANPRLETRHPLWQDAHKLHASRRKPYTLTCGLHASSCRGPSYAYRFGQRNIFEDWVHSTGSDQGVKFSQPVIQISVRTLPAEINRNSASPECMRLARGTSNSMSVKLRNTCVSLASDVRTVCAFDLVVPLFSESNLVVLHA